MVVSIAIDVQQSAILPIKGEVLINYLPAIAEVVLWNVRVHPYTVVVAKSMSNSTANGCSINGVAATSKDGDHSAADNG
eukprot:10517830-Ditylum_brightwellii.AAC.1